MPMAARRTDLHAPPTASAPPTPIATGEPTVLVGHMPAARVGDRLTTPTSKSVICQGDPTVLIGDAPAARVGDATTAGTVIVAGCPTVLLGSSPQADALRTNMPLCATCEEAAEGEL